MRAARDRSSPGLRRGQPLKTAVTPAQLAGPKRVVKVYGEQGKFRQPKRPLTGVDKALLEALWMCEGGVASGARLAELAGVPPAKVSGGMLKLQARGLVLRTGEGWRAEAYES